MLSLHSQAQSVPRQKARAHPDEQEHAVCGKTDMVHMKRLSALHICNTQHRTKIRYQEIPIAKKKSVKKSRAVHMAAAYTTRNWSLAV